MRSQTKAHLAFILERLEDKMLLAVDAYEDAKTRFAWRKDDLTTGLEGIDKVDAEGRAKDDDQIKKAISDAAFYAREAEMYASVISALKG